MRMKILGEKIFSRDAQGRLLSRIGTMFFRTPGLVTIKAVHAMQRLAWLEYLEQEKGRALTEAEGEEEISESVDLVFTEEFVLIRPNPERMDLAFKADEELQKIVPKRHIRFLNTHSAVVRRALCERGENWRMARQPISHEEMDKLIEGSKVAISLLPVYYYNRTTGSRFMTAGAFGSFGELESDAFRKQILEVVSSLSKRNRQGFPELDLFPPASSYEAKCALRALNVESLSDEKLRGEYERILLQWRMANPPELREETLANFEWRNEMCHILTKGPNETSAEEQELIAGISPEFYRQIEWLPGVRIVDGEVVFDSIYKEAQRTQDPELLAKCDNRVKSFLFNMMRLLGRVKYVNIGRISHSLARRPAGGRRSGNVYIMQYAEIGQEEPKVVMIRLQKWGVAEHLDEGKSLDQAIMEADEYSDYVLDRRLMCRQLGMNLPSQLFFERFTEKYNGQNQYKGISVRTAYFVREYERGMASDKISVSKYRNPAWALSFASLMGAAAAVDIVVGRRSTETGELLFDRNYEVVVQGSDGMPAEVKITDHAGSFVEYLKPLEATVAEYAAFALDRKEYVSQYGAFVKSYVEAFRKELVYLQESYRARRAAFDDLFIDRPYDTNGSGAYRWSKVLERLDSCDPERLAVLLSEAAGC
jgi:hypothetical protein